MPITIFFQRYLPVALLSISCLLSLGCKDTLIHDLDEYKANTALVILNENGIKAEKLKESSGWAILVPSSKLELALSSLKDNRLFQNEKQNNETFSQGWLKSREERKYEIARKQSLALEKTIEQIPGVFEARVHLHRKETNLYSKQGTTDGTAGVLLITINSTVDKSYVQKLVAGATGTGLDAVSVIALPQERTSPKHKLPLAKHSAPKILDYLEEIALSQTNQIIMACLLVFLLSLLVLRPKRSARNQSRPQAKLHPKAPPFVTNSKNGKPQEFTMGEQTQNINGA